MVEVPLCCLPAVVEWQRVNKLNVNPDKTVVMLDGKAEIFKDSVHPTFDGVILDPTVVLEKLVNAAAKSPPLTYLAWKKVPNLDMVNLPLRSTPW